MTDYNCFDLGRRSLRRLIHLPLMFGSSQIAYAQASTTVPPETTSSAVAAAPANRDQPGQAGLSEIVVTATRRATNVQNVPFAITAVGGDSLRDRGITSPAQLSGLAPSLNVDQGAGNGQTHVSIRGLASTDFSLGASSPIATYIDDIYQPYAFGIGTQIFDLNRIEVLRGPQGTLFGKNTTGGALLYYSQSPTFRDEGYLNIDGGGGEFRHYSVEGAFNKKIDEDLAARFSFRIERRDDFIHNLYDGSKLGNYTNYNARLQLAWNPGSATRINLKVFGLKNSGDAPSYVGKYASNPCNQPPETGYQVYFRCDAAGNPSPESINSTHVYSDVPISESYDNYGVTLKIEQSLGDYTLTSISNAQKGHYSVSTNDDGTAADLFHSRQRSTTKQASEELRIATPVEKPIKLVAGLYGQYDHIDADQGSGSTNVDPAFRYLLDGPGRQTTKTFAAFGNATWTINPVFSLIGGLRYSIEHKRIDDPFFATGAAGDRIITNDDIYFVNGSQLYDPTLGDTLLDFRDSHTWRRLSWDATANIKPREEILLYAKAADGFRSGGFPVGITNAGSFVQLKPEIVRSYEAGFKTEWLDRRLRVNGDVFVMNYRDQQVQVELGNGLPGFKLANAARSRIKGAELEIEIAPISNLHLSASGGYSDAKYRRYENEIFNQLVSLKGNNLPFAPRWTGNFAGSYRIPMGDQALSLDTDWTVRSRIYFDSFETSLISDRARVVGNLRLTYGDKNKGWTLAVYANNVTDQRARVFGYTTTTPDNTAFQYAANIYGVGRTWGLQAGFRF